MSDECGEILERLQLYLDAECNQDVAAAVAEHLQDCPPCLERADFERELRRIVAAKCRDRAPSGLVDRIRARLDLA